jgi:hypothetical protein
MVTRGVSSASAADELTLVNLKYSVAYRGRLLQICPCGVLPCAGPDRDIDFLTTMRRISDVGPPISFHV